MKKIVSSTIAFIFLSQNVFADIYSKKSADPHYIKVEKSYSSSNEVEFYLCLVESKGNCELIGGRAYNIAELQSLNSSLTRKTKITLGTTAVAGIATIALATTAGAVAGGAIIGIIAEKVFLTTESATLGAAIYGYLVGGTIGLVSPIPYFKKKISRLINDLRYQKSIKSLESDTKVNANVKDIALWLDETLVSLPTNSNSTRLN